jgi:predicted flap endonuclease-1-like 5' DNA nuclease
MANISDIEGIGDTFAARLKESGITTTESLLEAGGSKDGRASLAQKTGISDTLILKWVNRADLSRINGVGSEYADLLEASGVDSVPELAQRNATNLALRMSEINEAKSLVRRVPTEAETSDWIEQAKALPRAVTY